MATIHPSYHELQVRLLASIDALYLAQADAERDYQAVEELEPDIKREKNRLIAEAPGTNDAARLAYYDQQRDMNLFSSWSEAQRRKRNSGTALATLLEEMKTLRGVLGYESAQCELQAAQLRADVAAQTVNSIPMTRGRLSENNRHPLPVVANGDDDEDFDSDPLPF